jgi:hypothetical protein
MIDWLIAAVLLQAAAPNPCNAATQSATPRPGCPRWRTLARDAAHASFYDPASVVRGNGGFGITMRMVYSEDQQYRIRSALVRYRFDCVARTSVGVHVTLFDAAGVRLRDDDVPPRTPRAEEPGTPSAALLDTFCPATR